MLNVCCCFFFNVFVDNFIISFCWSDAIVVEYIIYTHDIEDEQNERYLSLGIIYRQIFIDYLLAHCSLLGVVVSFGEFVGEFCSWFCWWVCWCIMSESDGECWVFRWCSCDRLVHLPLLFVCLIWFSFSYEDCSFFCLLLICLFG